MTLSSSLGFPADENKVPLRIQLKVTELWVKASLPEAKNEEPRAWVSLENPGLQEPVHYQLQTIIPTIVPSSFSASLAQNVAL